jgi:S-adenosyl-L-methionine hydrolase (adenosine-forming)
MAKQAMVTLLTDFGLQDGYVAAMKGVILTACPRAQIEDISHDVPAHDVLAAALVLEGAAPYFPPDTLHVVVVDPGVGTERRILAGRFRGQTYLFPDNGVISMIAERGPAEELVAVRNTDYLPPRAIPSTFHGRDIFAPLAAHILNGLSISRLGPQPDTFKLFDLPACRQEGQDIIGQVIYIDRFGNLVTNIPAREVTQHWDDLESISARCGDKEAGMLLGAYGFVEPGQPLAVFNSSGRVELAVNRGRASDVFQAAVGTEVRLRGK